MFEGVIGNTLAMQKLYLTMAKVSQSSAAILIQGESGTGKELVARCIHKLSDRADKPFLALNCAAIPGDLLESELFGHSKGSFTGAHSDHEGIFKAASGGTIFLDEIGDMPMVLQAKLLRVLQDSKIRPVGSNHETSIDVRILAATNQNLEELVLSKSFREDLYFRLNVIPLQVPPLRERVEDFPLLVDHFVHKFSKLHNKDIESVDPEVMDAFKTYSWPGNVRELENAIERAVLLAESPRLQLKDFTWLTAVRPEASDDGEMFKVPLGIPLRELEAQYIRAYCRAHADLTQEDLAQGLGINRKTLYRKFQSTRDKEMM